MVKCIRKNIATVGDLKKLLAGLNDNMFINFGTQKEGYEINSFSTDSLSLSLMSDNLEEKLKAKSEANGKQISIVWSVEDVQEIRPDLNDEQAYRVLQKVEEYHDADIGVNWDTLSCWADELFPEK